MGAVQVGFRVPSLAQNKSETGPLHLPNSPPALYTPVIAANLAVELTCKQEHQSFGEALMRFRDRSEAGQLLARILERYKGRDGVLVLGLPRGGVPVAYEVARALHLPLDVFIVRKLGVPGHEELAMGAVATGGVRNLNQSVIKQLNIPPAAIEEATVRALMELQRRERLYRGDRPPLDVAGQTVIVIDDGLATGATMRAAVASLRHQNPAKIVVAVPIGAAETCTDLHSVADEVVCPATPVEFYAVGLWYEDFDQTTDAEVTDLIHRAA